MAFLEELKQRKVVRVAVAYLVVAWLGVQVASIGFPAFDAPAWVLRVFILVVALGFPLALVLAWAIDLTPEGPRFMPGGTGWKRMLTFSVALVVLAIGWYGFGQPAFRVGERRSAGAIADTARAPIQARSIAVLPFVNMSGDPANEYFSDGLAETTLDMLAQVHDLKVIARTSSFAFKGKPDDVRTIGRKLDAAHLLEGSVQQAGQTVRITAQLIRTSDGVHLWSHRYDRQLTDVFKIQDEIATEVVKALQLALPAAERARVTGTRTEDVAAYQEYLRGIALLPGRRVPDLRQAVAHFRRAVELDPKFARAHAQLSLALGLLNNYAGSLDAEQKALRASSLATALKLDPGLGEAYAARGAFNEEHQDLAAAEADYRRATELSPNFGTAFQWYGELATTQKGDAVLGQKMLARAVELDPLSPIIRSEYAMTLAQNGEDALALAKLDEVLRDNPKAAMAHVSRARLLEFRGDLAGTLREHALFLASDPEARARTGARCYTLVRFGALAEARRCVDAPRGPHGEDFAEEARIALLMAEPDYAAALAANRVRRRADQWEQAFQLTALHRGAEAVSLLQQLEPEMFIQPEPNLQSAYAYDAVLGGMALLESGAKAQGRDLLQRALRANASKPIYRFDYGRGWSDVFAWAALGDTAKACASTREAVAAGMILDLPWLEHQPLLADLAAQPCFAAALAPARAKAAAQVAAARKAGLLTPFE